MQMVTEYSEKQMREIGERIKLARRARGLNQGQLCDRARIPSTKLVSKYELGLDIPRGERLKAIAKACNVSEHYILEGETMAMSSVSKKPQIATVITPVVPKAEEPAVEKPKITYADKRSNYIWPNAAKLRELRKKHKLSTKDVAILCNLSSGYSACQWEMGKHRMAPSQIKILAEYYGVPYDDLVDASRADDKPKYAADNLKNSPAMIKHREKLEEEAKQAEPKKDKPVMDIPERAEDYFCKNVKYYITQREIKEDVFEKAVGCDVQFLDQVISHSFKLPLTVILKIARLLNMSVEELVADTSAMKIEQEIAEYEAKIRELRKQIGR